MWWVHPIVWPTLHQDCSNNFQTQKVSLPNFIYCSSYHRMAPGSHSNSWQNTCAPLLAAVNNDTSTGVMELPQATREHYWQHLKNFLPTGIDQHLQNLDAPEQILVIQAFDRWVWEGVFRQGWQIKAGSIQTAVAKTIELAGFPNPIHSPGTTNYQLPCGNFPPNRSLPLKWSHNIKTRCSPNSNPQPHLPVNKNYHQLKTESNKQTGPYSFLFPSASWQINLSWKARQFIEWNNFGCKISNVLQMTTKSH